MLQLKSASKTNISNTTLKSTKNVNLQMLVGSFDKNKRCLFSKSDLAITFSS